MEKYKNSKFIVLIELNLYRKLLIDYELMPGNVLKKEKNEEKAKTYRNQGNVKYQRKNFLGALELYNKSLCFSPDDCENIGTVYASEC